MQVRGGPAARVDVHLPRHFDAHAAIAVHGCGVVLADDGHRRGPAVDDEQPAAAEREEDQAAGGIGHRTDRRVVGPERCRFARQAIRRRAAGQVQGRRRLVQERIGRVVGADALEQLAVLVGHGHIRFVRRGVRHVRLARAAGAHRHPQAGQRLARCRVHEQHVDRSPRTR